MIQTCEKCGNILNLNVGQNLVNGKIVWFVSGKCSKCGFQIEQDGKNDTPDEVRNTILAQEGEWSLRINQKEVDTKFLKVVRETLNISFDDLVKIKGSIPGIIITGTKTEMERLKIMLSPGGYDLAVTKHPTLHSSFESGNSCI
jgi:ribosomal protein L24E